MIFLLSGLNRPKHKQGEITASHRHDKNCIQSLSLHPHGKVSCPILSRSSGDPPVSRMISSKSVVPSLVSRRLQSSVRSMSVPWSLAWTCEALQIHPSQPQLHWYRRRGLDPSRNSSISDSGLVGDLGTELLATNGLPIAPRDCCFICCCCSSDIHGVVMSEDSVIRVDVVIVDPSRAEFSFAMLSFSLFSEVAGETTPCDCR